MLTSRGRTLVKRVSVHTMNSSVREILLDGVSPLVTPMLNDFLRHNVGGRGVVDCNENVTMEAFVVDPAMYIQEEELRNRITALPAYVRAREDMELRDTLQETASNLERSGVYSLQQWERFPDKGRMDLMVRGMLNGALAAVEGERLVSECAQSRVIEGAYESVYNATWHYVEGVGGGGFGMEVREGHPPTVWTDKEVMRGSVEEDNDDERPVDGRLELMVLTSKNGWPYTDFCNWGEGGNIYINKEVMRVCHKVLEELDVCLTSPVNAALDPTPYLLFGTPGIGKSFAAGSFFLHQLLHYDAEQLPVVAYFVRGDAYLFERNSDGGRVIRGSESEMLRYVVRDLSRRKRGYIIYDTYSEIRIPPLSLPPPGWGMMVISSHDVGICEEWEKQRMARWIIMNCPTLRDIKAICAWEKGNQSNERGDYWKIIKERINAIGPSIRCIFNDKTYLGQCNDVNDALRRINACDVLRYKSILRGDGIWDASHCTCEILKVYRVVINDCDIPMNAAINGLLYDRIFAKVIMFLQNPVMNSPAIDGGRLNVEKFEQHGVVAFTDRNFLRALSKELQVLQPPGRGRRRGRKSVLQREGFVACASDGCLSFPIDSDRERRRRIECNKLYRPSAPNFPVVDAFYFVKAPQGGVTLIGIQTRAARSHHPTVAAVGEFRKYLDTCFSDWAVISGEVSWEIIHMQPQVGNENREAREWQGCALNPSGSYTAEEQNAIITFWCETVNQYHVNMSLTMVLHVALVLEAMDSRIIRLMIKEGRN